MGAKAVHEVAVGKCSLLTVCLHPPFPLPNQLREALGVQHGSQVAQHLLSALPLQVLRACSNAGGSPIPAVVIKEPERNFGCKRETLCSSCLSQSHDVIIPSAGCLHTPARAVVAAMVAAAAKTDTLQEQPTRDHCHACGLCVGLVHTTSKSPKPLAVVAAVRVQGRSPAVQTHAGRDSDYNKLLQQCYICLSVSSLHGRSKCMCCSE